jgi:murein DD-endopeptidase MepM/ murein hydrolase activator NlpD
MRERFSIVITDINGSKHYNLHQIIKKVILYIILAVIAIIIIGAFIISYLDKSVDDLEVKKEKLENVYQKLKNDNETVKKSIQKKVQELDLLSSKMGELEELIGIKPSSAKTSLNERVDLAKVSTMQKQLLFKNIPNGYPIKKEGITGSFGWRNHPIVKKREFHTGIDLRAKRNTKIYAPADGVINFAGFHKKSGYGVMIILDHNYGFRTLYGHMNKVAVKKGDVVRKGDLIGYTGNTGLSSGPHLHYEIRHLQVAVQPLSYMKWNMKTYETIFKKEKRIKWQSLINLMTSQVNPTVTHLEQQ